jgi:hypothetical protein
MREIMTVKLVKEITPPHLRCIPASCPAVYTLEDGNLLIIGKKPSSELNAEVKHKVGDDEYAVVLSPEFFQNLPASS